MNSPTAAARFTLGSLLVLVGLLVFANGFFLTRVELKNEGSCVSQSPGICNIRRKYDKVVFIVIDALRLDFVVDSALSKLHDEQDEDGASNLYLNKLTSIRNILTERPNNTFIARLDADPPTTTMQRLKGIVTGGLPTFIDIKDDVASEKIYEDNLLNQLSRAGRRITFMGDDTWVKLFPGSFQKQFPYESFNVKDLDTLDLGVREHLEPELSKSDWDVLVAHFLGVDHAGHRYGPRHPEMTRKLLEMDTVLASLMDKISKLSGDVLLLVVGDHGMTEDGNHGGATEEERSSVIFAYSPRLPLFSSLFKEINNGELDTVQQIDLAPTLALLLDIPIPFGSLGFMVPALIAKHAEAIEELIEAAHNNLEQIFLYLDTYSKVVGGSISEALVAARMEHADIKNEKNAISKLERIRRLARTAAEEARSRWTQFSLPQMLTGILIGLLGIILQMSSVSTFGYLPPGVIISWVGSLLALLSNSYIVGEVHVILFILGTCIVLDSTEPTKIIRILAISRFSLLAGEFMRKNGHEVRDIFGCVAMSILPLLYIVWNRFNAHRLRKQAPPLVLLLQTLLCVVYWVGAMMHISVNIFAQICYLLTVYALWYCEKADDILISLTPALSLILGPGGSLIILFFHSLSMTLLDLMKPAILPFWRGATLGILSTLFFFSSGHSCVFGTLRITAPYVGFEQFGYWRGIIMLSLDTFSAHMLGVLCTHALAGNDAILGYMMVFGSRAIVSTCFVFYARRHLMVWAIFAPKFVFDASAYAAVLVFHSLISLMMMSRRRSESADKPTSTWRGTPPKLTSI